MSFRLDEIEEYGKLKMAHSSLNRNISYTNFAIQFNLFFLSSLLNRSETDFCRLLKVVNRKQTFNCHLDQANRSIVHFILHMKIYFFSGGSKTE